jgi:hypothetical protein
MADFHIFEIFSDGSFIWRGLVSGQFEKECRLQELGETSDNRFYALNLVAGETLPLNAAGHVSTQGRRP